MLAAAHAARMRTPDKQGFATRAHYEGQAKRAALVHGKGSAQHDAALALLDGPEVPPQLEYLWSWFQQLDSRRQSGMNGPEPLTHQEIKAWAELYGHSPDALELEALSLLDTIARHPDALKAEDDD